MFERILKRLIQNAADGDVRRTIIGLQYMLSVRHTTVVCNIVGATATDITTWVLIGLDFSINIYLCLRIVWLNKRHPESTPEQIELLQDLALYELVEFQTPLAFILVFSVAYYGPNGSLFGNILNDYWTYTAIDDIKQMMINTGFFFMVDFSSTIICATILKVFCEINL